MPESDRSQKFSLTPRKLDGYGGQNSTGLAAECGRLLQFTPQNDKSMQGEADRESELAEKLNSPEKSGNSLEEQAQRDAIAAEYFDLLPFEPYPVQEEALLAWFTSGTLNRSKSPDATFPMTATFRVSPMAKV